MSPPPHPDPVAYEFGTFVLEVRERRLLRDGHPVPLRAKVFDTLALLVANAGRLLHKDDLMGALWPDTVVGDNNLNHNVAAIRRALGEQAVGSRYVETVPRQGYRFVAAVRVRSAPVSPAAPVARRLAPAPPGACPVSERRRPLAALLELWARARRGRRQTVLVSGEPGVGKTALVEAFLAAARVPGEPRIAFGQCLEQRGPAEPFMPALEAVARLCREPDGEDVVAELRRRAPSWLAQMPWLTAPAEAVGDGREAPAARRRMLREAGEAIEAVSASRPLVLVFDDLHWADPSTVDLVVRLARGRDAAHLFLICTCRPADTASAIQPFDGAARELVSRAEAVEICLENISEAGVAEYLSCRFPDRDFPAGLAALVHGRTGGNPLWLASLFDDWVREGILAELDGRWRLCAPLAELESDLPATLHGLVEQRLERLPAEDQALLAAGSVLGFEFAAAAAAAALGAEPEEIESRCDRLARRRVFLRRAGLAAWPDGTVSGSYAFLHAVYQQALSERVPPGCRERYRRRMESRLEAAVAGAEAEQDGGVLHLPFAGRRR